MHNKSVAQVVLRWLMQREVVIIPKSVSLDRMKEKFGVFDWRREGDSNSAVSIELGDDSPSTTDTPLGPTAGPHSQPQRQALADGEQGGDLHLDDLAPARCASLMSCLVDRMVRCSVLAEDHLFDVLSSSGGEGSLHPDSAKSNLL